MEMEANATAPKRQTIWRSWDPKLGEDLVMMPRALALDLVRLTHQSVILGETSEEDCAAGLHEARFEAHKERMEKLVGNVTSHLCDEGLEPTADLTLRALVIAYEAAESIGGI
jgi:hypothetical protein